MSDDRQQQVEQWWARLARALDVDPAVTSPDDVLDLAAVAAHEVLRPAAPLSTFLVGYAAGRAGGGADAVAAARRTAEELARGADA